MQMPPWLKIDRDLGSRNTWKATSLGGPNVIKCKKNNKWNQAKQLGRLEKKKQKKNMNRGEKKKIPENHSSIFLTQISDVPIEHNIFTMVWVHHWKGNVKAWWNVLQKIISQ